MRRVNVFWTGGLDSSFRMMQLSRMDVEIQPIYLSDADSGKTRHERNAMAQITDDLKNNPQTKATILPLIVVKGRLPIDDDIAKAYEFLKGKYHIGTQYRKMAQITRNMDIKVEVCLEYSTRSKACDAVNTEGTLLETVCDDGYQYLALSEDSSEEVMKIYGNLRFPLPLYKMTKEDEVETIKQMGLFDTMKKTWFCHYPIFGYPCGHCNPCKDALNEGMEWRVPKKGYYLGCFFYWPLRVWIKLKRETKKIRKKILGKR